MLKKFALSTYVKTSNAIASLVKDNRGASLTEYGAVLALVLAVCLAALTNLGTTVQTMFTDLVTAIGAI